MNFIHIYSVLILSVAISASGCNNSPKEKTAEVQEANVEKQPIMLTPASLSPEYPGATLKINKPSNEKVGTDSTKLAFSFSVNNYELKAQTADNQTKACNNSDKGQHIHFILDNQPYKALYDPKNDVTLLNGTEHTLLCFLSRSYHEALKNKEAAAILHFKIDENGKYKQLAAPTEPMLFYSRPKGDYAGKDTANLLLDFYIANCSLSDTGYYVNAHITNVDKGTDTTFKITQWKPNFIQNLGVGKCKAELTLRDAKQPDKTFTTVTREFKLMTETPAQ
jgi:hypothetical protein